MDGEYEARHTSRVIAYALKTGEELWSDTPQFAHDGYATPVVYDDGHQKLLLALTSRTLVGYVIANGAVAWRLDLPVGQPIPSPVIANGRLYVTGGVGSDSYTAAFRLRRNAVPDALWVSQQRADVSSPVLYRGMFFAISSTGVMVCYDAESGRMLWSQRVGSGLGAFYASLVAADDKVYAVRSNGTTYVDCRGRQVPPDLRVVVARGGLRISGFRQGLPGSADGLRALLHIGRGIHGTGPGGRGRWLTVPTRLRR